MGPVGLIKRKGREEKEKGRGKEKKEYLLMIAIL